MRKFCIVNIWEVEQRERGVRHFMDVFRRAGSPIIIQTLEHRRVRTFMEQRRVRVPNFQVHTVLLYRTNNEVRNSGGFLANETFGGRSKYEHTKNTA